MWGVLAKAAVHLCLAKIETDTDKLLTRVHAAKQQFLTVFKIWQNTPMAPTIRSNSRLLPMR